MSKRDFKLSKRDIRYIMREVDKDIRSLDPDDYEITLREMLASVSDDFYCVLSLNALGWAAHQQWRRYTYDKDVLEKWSNRSCKKFVEYVFSTVREFNASVEVRCIDENGHVKTDLERVPIYGSNDPYVKMICKTRFKTMLQNVEAAKASEQPTKEDKSNEPKEK